MPSERIQYNLFKKYLFIYLFMAVLGLSCYADFSLVAVTRGSSPVLVCRLLIVVVSLVEAVFRERGLQWLQLPSSRVQAQQLWCTGLVAQLHVESSQARDQTHVSCIEKRILYH